MNGSLITNKGSVLKDAVGSGAITEAAPGEAEDEATDDGHFENFAVFAWQVQREVLKVLVR